MVLLAPCIHCQHGHHDRCMGGRPAPKGVMGGWECSCECRQDKPESDRAALSATDTDTGGKP